MLAPDDADKPSSASAIGGPPADSGPARGDGTSAEPEATGLAASPAATVAPVSTVKAEAPSSTTDSEIGMPDTDKQAPVVVAEQAAAPSVEPHTLSWVDASVTVRTTMHVDGKKVKNAPKTIVQPTSGIVRAGHLLAIMGPSGSGKTTLLDTLAGRVVSSHVSGDVLVNGKALSFEERKRVMSYVAQEDTLMGQFTVTETLRFAARFHYGYGLEASVFDKKVSDAVEHMGLTDAADTLVGDIFRKGLSGGQKRRLSIAIELVSEPAIVMLDEPTSGLDSASAYGVVNTLTKLAKSGHTVLTTIHQPSSEIWALFDNFMLLSRGHTLYFGPASETVDYFAGIGFACPNYSNPADYFISIVNTDFTEFGESADPKQLEDKYNASALRTAVLDGLHATNAESLAAMLPDNKKKKGGAESKRHPFLTDFVVLMKRNLLNNLRNPGIYWVRAAMYVMLCLFVGFAFFDLGGDFTATSINSRVSILFFVQAFLVFMAVAAVPFFLIERSTFVRERSNGTYGTTAYVLANYFTQIPGLLMIALLSSICVVYPAGLNGFGVFFLALFVSLLTAESLMLLISACVPHFIIGIAIGAGVCGIFMVRCLLSDSRDSRESGSSHTPFPNTTFLPGPQLSEGFFIVRAAHLLACVTGSAWDGKH